MRLAPGFSLGASAYIMLFPRQENADRSRNQDKGSQPDKQPFQCVQNRAGNGQLRVMIIPTQVRTIRCQQNRETCQDECADGNQQPMEHSSSEDCSPCKL